MARRVRRLAVVVLVLLVAGAVALVLTARPRLEDRRDDVDRAWTPLRAPLGARYEQLAAVNEQMGTAGAGDRSVTRALSTTLARWDRLRRARDGDADAEAEAETADELEGLATRLRALVQSSDRLRGVDPLNQALAAFQGAVPPLPAVKTYNDAAEQYEDTRNSFLRRPVASLFDYEARPQLLLGT
jgi:HAMP domain-containing protein